jgi:hypothetical protein
MPISSSVFPALSSTSFRVSSLILRSLIYFELVLVQGDKHGCCFIFLQTDIQFSQKHLTFLYPMFLVPLSTIRWALGAWIHIQILYSAPLSSYLFLCQYLAVFYCCVSVVCGLRLNIMILPVLLLLLSIALDIHGLLCF